LKIGAKRKEVCTRITLQTSCASEKEKEKGTADITDVFLRTWTRRSRRTRMLDHTFASYRCVGNCMYCTVHGTASPFPSTTCDAMRGGATSSSMLFIAVSPPLSITSGRRSYPLYITVLFTFLLHCIALHGFSQTVWQRPEYARRFELTQLAGDTFVSTSVFGVGARCRCADAILGVPRRGGYKVVVSTVVSASTSASAIALGDLGTSSLERHRGGADAVCLKHLRTEIVRTLA
jgi:hypothetical protein